MRWSDERQQEWRKAEPAIQEFYNKWHESSNTALSHQVNIGHIPEFGKAPDRFIVRNSYKTTFDQVWQWAFVRPKMGIILAGQPGIGKTYFLWYALIRLIKQGQPVAFFTEGTVYLFYENDVWLLKTTSTILFPIAKAVTDLTEHRPFLFVLIDHDISTLEPLSVLHSSEAVFPIQASYPNPNHFNKWAKRRNAGIWGLPLWEEAELNMAYASLEESILMCSNSQSIKGSEKASPQVQVALDTLKEWTDKKNRLLKSLKTDDDSCQAKTKDIEDKNGIYGVDMSTINGALKVLLHTAVQDVGLVARDVFERIFYPTAAAENQAEAINHVTYENLQQLSKSFQEDHTFTHQTISH
ncbi:hypothetical protein Clacol_001151 [Clathrus columnatus]|uniref:Uncharacterized protein n=1 Tax=Clathrus columnatus TaxID=1419009 RepID=A0AAV5A2I3_9AGAM|nr:hypothetical protein Clacol_001151 [Clathrus columnatus]